jgi:hypothetical protein
LILASVRVKENATQYFDSLVQRNSFKLRDLHDGLKADISATLDLKVKLQDEIVKGLLWPQRTCYCFGITKDLMRISLSLPFSVVTAKLGRLTTPSLLLDRDDSRQLPLDLPKPLSTTSPLTSEFASNTMIYECVKDWSHTLMVITGIYAKPWDLYVEAEDDIRRQQIVKVYLDLERERVTAETTMDLEDNNLTQAVVQDLVADVVIGDTTVQQAVDL